MNNISLYTAAAQVRELLDQIDPETGELPEGFDNARALVASKATAVAAFVLENDAQAAMVEQHAKALLDRVKTAKKRSDWLRQYLRTHMAESGIQKIASEDGTFTAKLETGRDKSVEIFDARMLPSDYMREIPATQEPDKLLIRKALDDGYDVPGARIVAKDRLTLR